MKEKARPVRYGATWRDMVRHGAAQQRETQMHTYYSEDHEWITVDGETATIGITQHAADQLGEIVFIEQREVGDTFARRDEIGVIESVKAASEIYAPVDGEMIEVNAQLADSPSLLNESPEAEAWIYRIRLSNPQQLEDLMSREDYQAMID